MEKETDFLAYVDTISTVCILTLSRQRPLKWQVQTSTRRHQNKTGISASKRKNLLKLDIKKGFMNIIEETDYLCPHCAGDVVKVFRNEEEKRCMDGEYRCMSCDNIINASTQSTIWPYKQKVKIESNENYLPKNYIENLIPCSNYGFNADHLITESSDGSSQNGD